jgi:hypothetical protein
MIGKKNLIEGIGLAAVVLSLVFVGLEINESTRATRSATAADTTATIAEWYSSISTDEQLSRVFRTFVADPQALTVDEQYQATMAFHALMLILQSSFYLEKEGTLSPALRRSMTQAILPKPGVRFYWEQRKSIFVNEEFVAFVEQTLAGENSHSEDLYLAPQEQQ